MKLAIAIEELFRFLSNGGYAVPKRPIAMIELSPRALLPDGRYEVAWESFKTVEEYGSRFEDLQIAGFPWINLTCLGVVNESLVLGVELPSSATGAGRTSVNYSGPERRVLDANWSAVAVLSVRPRA